MIDEKIDSASTWIIWLPAVLILAGPLAVLWLAWIVAEGIVRIVRAIAGRVQRALRPPVEPPDEWELVDDWSGLTRKPHEEKR